MLGTNSCIDAYTTIHNVNIFWSLSECMQVISHTLQIHTQAERAVSVSITNTHTNSLAHKHTCTVAHTHTHAQHSHILLPNYFPNVQ